MVAPVSGSEPIVIVSSAMTSTNSNVIFLESPIILPNDQPDLLQQALAEVALPSNSTANVPTKLPIQTKEAKDHNFVTVFNSRDGTLRLSQENARALGIGITTNESKLNYIRRPIVRHWGVICVIQH